MKGRPSRLDQANEVNIRPLHDPLLHERSISEPIRDRRIRLTAEGCFVPKEVMQIGLVLITLSDRRSQLRPESDFVSALHARASRCYSKFNCHFACRADDWYLTSCLRAHSRQYHRHRCRRISAQAFAALTLRPGISSCHYRRFRCRLGFRVLLGATPCGYGWCALILLLRHGCFVANSSV